MTKRGRLSLQLSLFCYRSPKTEVWAVLYVIRVARDDRMEKDADVQLTDTLLTPCGPHYITLAVK